MVQDFLTHIFPNAFFLREFLTESEIAMGYTSAIPNLFQTAKYSFDRFENFFTVYHEILDSLIDYLPKHVPKITKEAQAFFDVYDMIYAKFTTMGNFSKVLDFSDEMANRTDLTRDEMKQSIYEDFNATLSYSYDLFRYLNRFDDELSVRGLNFTSEQMQEAIFNFTLDPETNVLLGEINLRSTSIWDSLSFYGFWYVISSYVVPQTVSAPKRVPFSFDSKQPSESVNLTKLESSTPSVPLVTPSNADKKLLEQAIKLEISQISTTEKPIKERRDHGHPEQHEHHFHATTPVASTTTTVEKSTEHLTTVAQTTTSIPPSPTAGAIVVETTTTTTIPSTTTVMLTTLKKKFGKTTLKPQAVDSTTVLPSAAHLERDSTTTVHLVVDTTTKPTTVLQSTGHLKHDSTPILKRTTTVLPSAEHLERDTTTIRDSTVNPNA